MLIDILMNLYSDSTRLEYIQGKSTDITDRRTADGSDGWTNNQNRELHSRVQNAERTSYLSLLWVLFVLIDLIDS